jgi:hypothetical protein
MQTVCQIWFLADMQDALENVRNSVLFQTFADFTQKQSFKHIRICSAEE